MMRTRSPAALGIGPSWSSESRALGKLAGTLGTGQATARLEKLPLRIRAQLGIQVLSLMWHMRHRSPSTHIGHMTHRSQ